MTITNQNSTRSQDDIRIFAPWTYILFTVIFLIIVPLAVFVMGKDNHAPTFPVRCLLGVLVGIFLGCYAVLIGYVNQDAGRRGMSRLLWTLISLFVPNGLGIVLYFVLRKPRIAHCPQCDHELEPGFSFCPHCSFKLNPSCPQCQRPVGVNDIYCPYCGTSMRGPAVSS